MKKRTLFMYTKDTSLEDGKPNPVPKCLRQRRQVIAGLFDGKNLNFGLSECSHHDVFKKVTGRNKAAGFAVSNPVHVIENVDATQLGKIFTTTAKTLFRNGPKLHVTTVTKYSKAK